MQKIEFNQERDFSKVYSDTFAFIKQNFKSFFGSILLIAGPFLLISGASMGYMQSGIIGIGQGLLRASDFQGSMVGWFAVIMFFTIVGNAVLYSVVFNYMILYYTKPFGEKITVSEVGQKVLSNIGRVLGAMFTFIVFTILIAVVVGLLMYGIATALGTLGAILLVLAVLVLGFIYGPVLFYYFSSVFFVVIRDEQSFVSSWRKVSRYLRGSFWWTWLIMFIAVVVLYIVNLVFSLPATIIAMMNTFTRVRDGAAAGGNSVALIVFYTFAMFMSYCTSSFLLVLGAFNFLGQEEKNEGKGLLSRIDEIK